METAVHTLPLLVVVNFFIATEPSRLPEILAVLLPVLSPSPTKLTWVPCSAWTMIGTPFGGDAMEGGDGFAGVAAVFGIIEHPLTHRG